MIAAPASADQLTVDFESGPALDAPITNEYLASAFVQWEQADPGYRPYRMSAPGKARSGSVVADVGSRLCAAEEGAGVGCEFPGAFTDTHAFAKGSDSASLSGAGARDAHATAGARPQRRRAAARARAACRRRRRRLAAPAARRAHRRAREPQRLVADARVATIAGRGAPAAGSVTVHRSAAVRVR